MGERQRPGDRLSSAFARGQTAVRPGQSDRSPVRVAGRSRRGGWRPSGQAARRPQKGRLLRLARHLGLLALVAGLAVAGWWLYLSPWLRIQEVTVEGTRLLDPEYVLGAADLRGDSVFFPDTGGARRRLEDVPMVKSVTFERDWPRGMRIIVKERRAWGFWETRARRYVIDEDGVVLERVLPDEGAPVIRQLDAGDTMQPGDRVDPDAVALTRRIAEAAPERLGLTLDTAEYQERDGLTAVFVEGLRATFGDGRDFDYKMAALQALLERTQQEGVAVRSVDLRFGERIAFQ